MSHPHVSPFVCLTYTYKDTPLTDTCLSMEKWYISAHFCLCFHTRLFILLPKISLLGCPVQSLSSAAVYEAATLQPYSWGTQQSYSKRSVSPRHAFQTWWRSVCAKSRHIIVSEDGKLGNEYNKKHTVCYFSLMKFCLLYGNTIKKM